MIAPDLPRRADDALVGMRRVIPRDAVLIGHSYGAILALQLQAEARRPFTGIVLSSSFFPPARNGRTTIATLADYVGHRVAFVGESRASPRPRSTSGVGRREGLATLIRFAGRPAAFRALTDAGATPVLVLHAADDHYVPVDFAMAVVAQRPAWTLAVLEAGGHYPHRDVPRAWIDVVASWIETLSDR